MTYGPVFSCCTSLGVYRVWEYLVYSNIYYLYLFSGKVTGRSMTQIPSFQDRHRITAMGQCQEKNELAFMSLIFCKTSVITKITLSTVEFQWLEHLLDHGNLFEIWVVRATEG